MKKLFFIVYPLMWIVLFSISLFFLRDNAKLSYPFIYDSSNFFGMKLMKSIVIGVFGLGAGLLVELKVVGWKKSGLKKMLAPSSSTRKDILTCLLHISGIWRIIGHVTILGLPYFLGPYIAKNNQLQFIAYIPTDLGKAIVTLLILSFFEYWGHRIFHRFGPLWEIHKYHHTATEMSVFSANRNHPLAEPLLSVITTIPFVFFGATLGSFFWIGGIRIVLDYVIHSEIKSDWGFIGRWILVSPAVHRLHHSKESKHYNCNFGFFIIFWDRVFKTYKLEQARFFGTDDKFYNNQNNLFVEFIHGIHQSIMQFKELICFPIKKKLAKRINARLKTSPPR